MDAIFLEQRGQVGEKTDVEFIRAGKRRHAHVELRTPTTSIPLGFYEGEAPYRIYAGLVFQPLTLRYLALWEDDPPSHLEVLRRQSSPFGDDGDPAPQEFVVLSGLLHNELTQGYRIFDDEVVHSVDGQPVRSLRHLSGLLDAAAGDFVSITLQRGGVMVLPRAEAEAANAGILARYGVATDRSRELRKLLARDGDRRGVHSAPAKMP